MTRQRKRQTVYIVVTAPDFLPEDTSSMPALFLAGEVYKENVSMCQAVGFAQAFNAQVIKDCRFKDGWNRHWAIVTRRLKAPAPGNQSLAQARCCCWSTSHKQGGQQRRQEGGVA